MNSNNKKLLGNKRIAHKEFISNNELNNNSLSSSSSSSSSSLSFDIENTNIIKENEKYKNIFSRKNQSTTINPSPPPFQVPKTQNTNIPLSSSTTTSSLSFLPPPKYKLIDRSLPLQIPHIVKQQQTTTNTNKPPSPKTNSTTPLPTNQPIQINQSDLIDSKWETKFIENLNKQELNSKPSPHLFTNKQNIKSLIQTYNTEIEQILNTKPLKSKYSKISTKAKYGW